MELLAETSLDYSVRYLIKMFNTSCTAKVSSIERGPRKVAVRKYLLANSLQQIRVSFGGLDLPRKIWKQVRYNLDIESWVAVVIATP